MLLTQELIERMRCTTEEKRSCLPLVDELLYCWSSHGRVVDMRNWVGDGSHKVWVRDKYGECLLPLPVSYDKEACGVELFRTVLINEVREAILREEYYLGSSNPLIAIFGLDFYEDINKLSSCDTHSAYHHYPKSFQTVSLSEIDRQIREIACDSPAFRKKVELCIPELVIMMQTARCEGLMALDFLEEKNGEINSSIPDMVRRFLKWSISLMANACESLKEYLINAIQNTQWPDSEQAAMAWICAKCLIMTVNGENLIHTYESLCEAIGSKYRELDCYCKFGNYAGVIDGDTVYAFHNEGILIPTRTLSLPRMCVFTNGALLFGFFDSETGRIIWPPQFKEVWYNSKNPTEDSLILVHGIEKEKFAPAYYGYMKMDGTWLVEPTLKYAKEFPDDFACVPVITAEGEYRFLYRDGHFSKTRYNAINLHGASDGNFWPAMRGDRCGAIDSEGAWHPTDDDGLVTMGGKRYKVTSALSVYADCLRKSE